MAVAIAVRNVSGRSPVVEDELRLLANLVAMGELSAVPGVAADAFVRAMMGADICVRTESLNRTYERPALRKSFAAFPADSKVAAASFAVIATVVSMSDRLPPAAAASIAEAAALPPQPLWLQETIIGQGPKHDRLRLGGAGHPAANVPGDFSRRIAERRSARHGVAPLQLKINRCGGRKLTPANNPQGDTPAETSCNGFASKANSF